MKIRYNTSLYFKLKYRLMNSQLKVEVLKNYLSDISIEKN